MEQLKDLQEATGTDPTLKAMELEQAKEKK